MAVYDHFRPEGAQRPLPALMREDGPRMPYRAIPDPALAPSTTARTDRDAPLVGVSLIARRAMQAFSLALVIGAVWWGVLTVQRQMQGVPVIMASDQPMRVLPDDPGGQQVAHLGLAVNDIAAGQEAAPAPETIILAPPPVQLIADPTPLFAASPAMAEAAPAERDLPVPEALPEMMPSAPPAASAAETPEAEAPLIAQAQTGLAPALSLIPQMRPESIASNVNEGAQAPVLVQEIDPATLAVGTQLVQLGAFGSADIARGEWDRLSGQFPDFFNGKTRVIQSATSGGQEFFRLRLGGFENADAARRFCTALLAQGVSCIPALVR